MDWPGPREVVAEAGLIPRHAVSRKAWVSEVKVGLAGRGGKVRRQQRQRGLASGLGLRVTKCLCGPPGRREQSMERPSVC